MIFDKITNHRNYRGLSKELDRALDYLIETDLEILPEGKHEIAGDDIYAACMSYDTKELSVSKNEAHRSYIDVQYVVSGTEKMHTSYIGNLKVTEEYDKNRDVIFYENACEAEINAQEGYFAVFFPEDAHIPGLIAESEAVKVKKVVVKVHV